MNCGELIRSKHGLDFYDDGVRIDREYDYSSIICKIDQMVRGLDSGGGELFSYWKDGGGYRLKFCGSGREFYKMIFKVRDLLRWYPGFRFSPYVQVYVDSVQEVVDEVYDDKCISESVAVELVGCLNACVREIVGKVSSSDFKNLLGRHRRSSNKNFKGLVNYVDNLFVHHSRVLVIRVDLGYSREYGGFQPKKKLDYAVVSEHKQKIIRAVRARYGGSGFLGYALKLEFGVSKSYHFHCVFFFNGARLREDIVIAKSIGELWVAEVTSGEGRYYNCNYGKERYRRLGVGMINHYDAELRENLKVAIGYLTKVDYFVRYIVPDNKRTFWRGEIVASRRVLGRPRERVS